MGVDQGKTGYISVVDWLFDHHPGSDISSAAIGKLLWFGKFAEDDWGYLGELMREWQVLACVVDADPERQRRPPLCQEVSRLCVADTIPARPDSQRGGP